MTFLDTLGSSFSGFAWSAVYNVTFVIVIFFFVVILIGAIAFFMVWKSYSYPVRIYEPRGQISMTRSEQQSFVVGSAKDRIALLKSKEIKFDQLKVRRTHGKYVMSKGTPYFATFTPFRKHQSVPMELLFHDGVHMLKLSREIYIPIPRPETTIIVGQNVSISIKENNEWRLWNNMMAERINNKYSDMEIQKKIILYVIVGIVAMVVLGGFILWLIYKSSSKGLDAADKLTEVATRLTGGGTPPA